MKSFANLEEKKIASKLIFDGRILHVYDDTVTLPNGEAASREVIRHVGAVCVIPVFENGDVLMERQFRYPVGRVVLEIPAGKLNSKTENHLEAAKRELHEETGCIAEHWRSLGFFHPACAYCDEEIEMFLATELSFSEQALDADEFLNVERIALDTLVSMVMRGEITDAKTQVAVLKAEKILKTGRE